MPSDHDDALMLAAADALAAWLHRDDKDKQGAPLIGHCRRVAATLKAEGWPVEVQAAGLLHDSIEHGRVWRELLGALFANDRRTIHFSVEGLVERVTRPQGISYNAYVRNVALAGSHSASVAIKLADLRDNLDPSRPIQDSLRKRYERAVAVLTAERAGEEG